MCRLTILACRHGIIDATARSALQIVAKAIRALTIGIYKKHVFFHVPLCFEVSFTFKFLNLIFVFSCIIFDFLGVTGRL